MKNNKIIGVALGAVGLMALAVGCTNKAGSNGKNGASSTAALYQNPAVNCAVNVGSSKILTINNLTTASNYSTPPSAPAQVSLNCAGSSASSNTPLTLSYSVNGGPYVPFNSGLQNLSDSALNFSKPGLNNLSVQATDGLGLVTTVNFTLPVSCDPTKYPALKGPTGLNIAQGAGGPGFVNVSFASGASGGGGGPYKYAINLMGDGNSIGRFDYYSAPNATTPSYWNTVDSWLNLYNFYSGSRNVYVQTFDTTCQFMGVSSYAYDWSAGVLSGAQTGTTASVEPYYYLQGNVTSLSNSTDPAETVMPFDARDQGLSGSYLHVNCAWADQAPSGSNTSPQAVFTISANNLYSDGNQNDSSQLTRSMALSWSILDNSSSSNLTLANTVPLTNMTYQTSASPGSYTQYNYNMTTGCSANVKVTLQQSPTTCTAGSTSSGYEWGNATISGTYSCPNLASVNATTARNISVTNGYFYCQTGPGNNCVGGGQEGGTPPTPF